MSTGLVERLRDADYRGPMQHLRNWSELDALHAEAANTIEALSRLDPRLTEWGYSSLEEALTHLGELLDNQTAFDGLSALQSRLSQAEADLAGARGMLRNAVQIIESAPLLVVSRRAAIAADDEVALNYARALPLWHGVAKAFVERAKSPPSNLDRKGT